MPPICYHCAHPYPAELRGRSEECSGCRREIHVCYNCEFYDRSAYNECRENRADRVVQKDRANFCDYFRPSSSASPSNPSSPKPSTDVVNALDALFKK